MKKLEIVIRPEKFESLKSILKKHEISGMMVSNVMGHGKQIGYQQQYRGNVYSVNLVNKLKVEIVVKDEVVDLILKSIADELPTGQVGDGKVFVYDVINAMRIRTGEKGEEAL